VADGRIDKVRMTPYHAATSPHMRFLILSRASSIRVYFPLWPKASVTEHPGARKVSEGKLTSKAIEHDG
jgi:hypothetical protein